MNDRSSESKAIWERLDRAALEAGAASRERWVLLTKFGRLDLQHLEPSVDYRVLAGAAIEDEVFGVAVTFCGYEHLIEMKRAAGRPQDLLDIDRLEQLRGVR